MRRGSEDAWRSRAVVEDPKILAYLLSATNDAGKSKAPFLGRHGFMANAPDILSRSFAGSRPHVHRLDVDSDIVRPQIHR